MTEDLWMTEFELIEDDLLSGSIDADEAKRRLRSLGFDADEAADHVEEMQK